MWTHVPEKAEEMGYIWTITGSIMTGKTSTLIRDVEALYEANYDVYIFMPKYAQTSRPEGVRDHDGDTLKYDIPTIFVDDSILIPTYMKENVGAGNTESPVVVIIDEAQFFEKDLFRDVKELASMGYDVGVYGLNHDVFGNSFPSVANVMAISDEVTILENHMRGWFDGPVPKLTDENFDRDGCLMLTDDKVKYKPISKQEWFKKLKEHFYA
jgi:thymidine kinase